MRQAPRRASHGFFIAALVAAAFVASAAAQPPTVTGVSSSDAATVRQGDQPAENVRANQMLAVGDAVEVRAGQSVMFYSPSDRVAFIAVGPAAFTVREQADGLELQLDSGVLLARTRTPAAEQSVRLTAPIDAARLSAAFGPGWTLAELRDGRARLGFVAAAGAEDGQLVLNVDGRELRAASGQMVDSRLGLEQSFAMDPWLSESGLDVDGAMRRYGVASAQVHGQDVGFVLQQKIIEWDRTARAGVVIASLPSPSLGVEKRQVTFTTTPLLESSTQRNQVRGTEGFPGANEVPTLSPAALSVGGVTALQLNNNARLLLQRTGSRGLGVNGPSQLAIPGFQNGRRTVGPSGLGAGP